MIGNLFHVLPIKPSLTTEMVALITVKNHKLEAEVTADLLDLEPLFKL